MQNADITFIPNSNRVRLLNDLSVFFDGVEYTIKSGYESDGISIPFFLWSFNLHPFQSDCLAPAIFHDIFYQSRRYARFTCDWNFLYLMKKNGASFRKRWAFFIAVLLFGWKSYYFHKAGVEENARQHLKVKLIIE